MRFDNDAPTRPAQIYEEVGHRKLRVGMQVNLRLLDKEEAAFRRPKSLYKNGKRLSDSKANVGKVGPSSRSDVT
jgi:hypothetical protein